jgi:post-segregation antitoxin (ccd killing protein)
MSKIFGIDINDVIKKKEKKKSNVFTVYLNDEYIDHLEFLRAMDVNVSLICREAMKEVSIKLQKKLKE